MPRKKKTMVGLFRGIQGYHARQKRESDESNSGKRNGKLFGVGHFISVSV
jgi:hypothetical protein